MRSLDVANLFYRAGAADRAEKIYREPLAANPNNVSGPQRSRVDTGGRRQAYEEALVLADRGVALAPDAPYLARYARGDIVAFAAA